MPSLNLKKLTAITVITLSVGVMTMLGFWQLDRMEQKQHRVDSIAQKQSEGSLDITDAMKFDDPRDVQVNFTGQPDTQSVLLLDNQLVNGRPGYNVFVPVNTNLGWVLADYGWVAAPARRDELPSLRLSDEQTRFNGVLTQRGDNPMARETALRSEPFPLRIQKLDTTYLGTLLERRLLPYTVTLTSESNQFFRRWEPVVMPPEKHLGYAIQWFGLAIAAFIIGLIAVVKRKST